MCQALRAKMNIKQPPFIDKDSQGDTVVVDVVEVGCAGLKEDRSTSGLAVALELKVKAVGHMGRHKLKILGILACKKYIFWGKEG